MHSLLILGILNDANIIFLDERLTQILVNILSTYTSSELSETCLELLHGQAEDGTIIILKIQNKYFNCLNIISVILINFLYH